MRARVARFVGLFPTGMFILECMLRVKNQKSIQFPAEREKVEYVFGF